MGSVVGVLVTAAKRVGVSVDQYRTLTRDGLKWCTSCKQWHPRSDFPRDRTRGDGLKASCLISARGKSRTPREQTKEDARHAVGYAVRIGRLANPNTLPCMDCGHSGGDKRHEYDHAAGYDAENWLIVEPVCTTCHAQREIDRKSNVR